MYAAHSDDTTDVVSALHVVHTAGALAMLIQKQTALKLNRTFCGGVGITQ